MVIARARALPRDGPQRLRALELSVVAGLNDAVPAVVRSGSPRASSPIVISVGGVDGYAVQIASAMGAKVVAIDVDDAKLALIAQHGAHATFNSRTTDFKTLNEIGAKSREWGLSRPRRQVFECSGSNAGAETAYGLPRPRGRAHGRGLHAPARSKWLSNLMAFDATVQGTWGCQPELYPTRSRWSRAAASR